MVKHRQSGTDEIGMSRLSASRKRKTVCIEIHPLADKGLRQTVFLSRRIPRRSRPTYSESWLEPKRDFIFGCTVTLERVFARAKFDRLQVEFGIVAIHMHQDILIIGAIGKTRRLADRNAIDDLCIALELMLCCIGHHRHNYAKRSNRSRLNLDQQNLRLARFKSFLIGNCR